MNKLKLLIYKLYCKVNLLIDNLRIELINRIQAIYIK